MCYCMLTNGASPPCVTVCLQMEPVLHVLLYAYKWSQSSMCYCMLTNGASPPCVTVCILCVGYSLSTGSSGDNLFHDISDQLWMDV